MINVLLLKDEKENSYNLIVMLFYEMTHTINFKSIKIRNLIVGIRNTKIIIVFQD